MKTAFQPSATFLFALPLLLAACGGGSSPPPASPSEAPSAGAAASSGAASDVAPATADAPKGGAADVGAAAPATPAENKASRGARDIIELKDTVFFLNFAESDPGKAAEASCSKASAKNPKKMTACMSKAMQQMDDEGHHFEETKDGTQWWRVIHRKGNALTTVHKVRFTYGAETPTSVVIKPEGKDSGTKPWKTPPSELKIDVPTEYRIVLQDPKYGKLVYEAKSGISGLH